MWIAKAHADTCATENRRYRSSLPINFRSMKRSKECTVKTAQQRIARIREAIADFDNVCSGSLQRRLRTCNRPRCSCSTKSGKLHGPYYQWARTRPGQRHFDRQLSPEQATFIEHAIGNYKKLKGLIRAWEKDTELIMDAQFAKPRKHGKRIRNYFGRRTSGRR